ncbi:hypothetical protein C0033_21595 [Clostridium sp. chh4-2]|nr:hypothetical protein C0033_21595 [Clostridium sp. chh4-2]
MQPNGIRDSPLRTTKACKDRTRQASAIRSELLMTSLLKGALETDLEFIFYLPRSALTGLSSSKGVPYDPIWLHLSSPARTAPLTFVFRLRLPIPCWFSLAWLKTMLLNWYLYRSQFTWIATGFSERPSGFYFKREGFSRKDLTLYIKS